MFKFWTAEEDNLLREIYVNGSKMDILSKFSDKKWRAIRQRACSLGLKRDKNKIVEDNILYTKKAFMDKYGVESSFMVPGVKDKIKKAHLRIRGVEYPSQSKEVREKVKKTVQSKYGVNNVFQADVIKDQIKRTSVERYGVSNPQKSIEIKNKTKDTVKQKYGVDNPFKMVDRVQQGMLNRYGVTSPLKDPLIRKKWVDTNIERYGCKYPSQNFQVKEKLSISHRSPEVREKKAIASKGRLFYNMSAEELAFEKYLRQLYDNVICQEMHPVFKYIIDYYLPDSDLWVQYDGVYWHGKNGVDENGTGRQVTAIRSMVERDAFQNKYIPNLVRFWSDDVVEAIKNGTILNFIKLTVDEKIKNLPESLLCHQYEKKIQWLPTDLRVLPFSPDNVRVSEFNLSKEEMSPEIVDFIKKYEWLGTVGVAPKWCFTARYKNFLGGVVLLNEPIAYSRILGEGTPRYEALIQRGATASWAPKNLGSRLVMFACRWMVQNTDKRAFTGYSDPVARERGIIYQACGFDFLGGGFGNSFMYRHSSRAKLFSTQTLRRTSAFKRWCRENGIEIQPLWIKENGFKDLSKIPSEVKEAWRSYILKILVESERVPVANKLKYVLVLGKDRRDKKRLNSLKEYAVYPYIKNQNNNDSICVPLNVFSKGTSDRKTGSKIRFIIENYGKLSRSDIACALQETERWVKRQTNRLLSSGQVARKNKVSSPAIILS